ncbi:MAG: hypothetical protein ABIR60_08505 [Allosphingosinicella sp.]
MPLIYEDGFGGLEGNAPNYVEPNNNPAPSPWSTDYTTPPGEMITIGPIKIISAKAAAAPGRTIKVSVKRKGGTGAKILDQILPLKVEQATGVQSIFGLPPMLVYLAGGVAVSALGIYAVHALKGGGRRRATASNPKRKARKKARRRAKR